MCIRDRYNDENGNEINLTVINTNARSLCPKINSLVDCFTDIEASIGVITETWLTDGDSLDDDVEDLVMAAGIRMIYKNRDKNNRGFSHGGVALVFKESSVALKEVKLHNPHRYEVVMACLLYTSPSPRDS